jgi:hypothetical protein
MPYIELNLNHTGHTFGIAPMIPVSLDKGTNQEESLMAGGKYFQHSRHNLQAAYIMNALHTNDGLQSVHFTNDNVVTQGFDFGCR